MSTHEPSSSRWSRWVVQLTGSAISALSSVARRWGAPTLLGVPVSAAILSRVTAVSPQQPLDEVAQLLVAGRHTMLPVVDHGKPVSVISRSDVAQAVAVVGPHAPVASAHAHTVITVAPGDSLAHVLERLQATPDSVAVVVDRGAPVGVLTTESVTAYLDDAARRAT